MKKVLMLIALTFGVLAFQGNFNEVEAQRGPIAVVKVRPTAKVVKRPRRPSKNHIWIANEWRWNGTTYVLVPGRWAKPRRDMVYRAGYWKNVKGGQVWVAGRWVRR